MRRLALALLLLAGACAHQAPPPDLRSALMNKCAAACSPADAVAASVIVASEADDLWQCLCHPAGAAVTPASNPGT